MRIEVTALRVKLLLLMIAFFACGTASFSQPPAPRVDVPPSWKKINAGGFFTFYLPGGTWDTGFRGTDDFYREYRVGKMKFMLVYEPMSVPAYDSRERVFGRGFQESLIEIGGERAYLFSYTQSEGGRRRYDTDLFVGDLPNARVKLWMQADSARPADLEAAKKIFRTVEFP